MERLGCSMSNVHRESLGLSNTGGDRAGLNWSLERKNSNMTEILRGKINNRDLYSLGQTRLIW